MKISNFLMICALSAFIVSCGGSQKVQNTGTEVEEKQVVSASGSKSSTGKCKTFTNKKEENEMLTKYSLYREPFKAKNYADGLENWTFIIQNFPGFRKTPFYDGIEMYKSQITGADANVQADLMRKVMSLYDGLAKCHGDAGEIARAKANEYLKWDKDLGTDNVTLIRKFYEESLAIEGNNVRSTVLKYLYSQYLSDFKNKLKTEAETKALAAKFRQIADFNVKANKETSKYEDLIASIDKGLYSKVTTTTTSAADFSTCESIIAYYQPKVDADPTDLKQWKYFKQRLDKLGTCKSNPVYNTVASTVTRLSPRSAGSVFKEAIGLYKTDKSSAKSLMKEALTMSPSADLAAQINSTLGDMIRGDKDYPSAARYYNASIASSQKFAAKSYYGLGASYLGAYGKCGTSDKEKAAVAWVAADMLQKAANMGDAKYSGKARNLLTTAKKYFLEKGEMFMAGIKDGDSVSVGCWINKTTKARGM